MKLCHMSLSDYRTYVAITWQRPIAASLQSTRPSDFIITRVARCEMLLNRRGRTIVLNDSQRNSPRSILTTVKSNHSYSPEVFL